MKEEYSTLRDHVLTAEELKSLADRSRFTPDTTVGILIVSGNTYRDRITGRIRGL
jgi:uncharacterized protein YerC